MPADVGPPALVLDDEVSALALRRVALCWLAPCPLYPGCCRRRPPVSCPSVTPVCIIKTKKIDTTTFGQKPPRPRLDRERAQTGSQNARDTGGRRRQARGLAADGGLSQHTVGAPHQSRVRSRRGEGRSHRCCRGAHGPRLLLHARRRAACAVARSSLVLGARLKPQVTSVCEKIE